ncbi:Hypothetical predicted protein [Olea europaea subsp. europaea]|uniref:Uncharacterized protein n=1 Tax=Olea europaea subsp. europaea TaxID=158383 RepID=A0A8S0TR04_OLEEU|nr:Hypothetical predicted protein [Olea europaea subsp. europaea]
MFLVLLVPIDVVVCSLKIWAYEAVPKLDEHFDQLVGERSPRLLCWTSIKQPQQPTYDVFFRDVQIVPFPDRPVQVLDNLARSVVRPQFHEAALANGGHDGSAVGDGHDDESCAAVEDNETSVSDDRQTPEGNGDDGSTVDESGDSSRDTSSETDVGDTKDDNDASGRQSGALPTPMDAPSTSGRQGMRGGPTVMRANVEGILLDQRTLIEMRLRTVKLEIIQHVTDEFTRLRDFISTLVPPSGGTSTSAVAHVMNEPNIWDDPHEGVAT